MNVTKKIHNKYFKDNNNITYIECGAVDGIHRSLCKYFYDLGHTGYNFEPNRYTFPKLNENRDKDTNINLVLSDSNGKVDFHVPVNILSKRKEKTGNGSCKYFDKWNNEIYKVETYLIESITYEKFIIDYNIKNIDFFVLDVEGNEREVIKGFGNSTILPKVIYVEVNKVKVNDLLIKLGYTLDKSLSGSEDELYVRYD